jgi:hypothetical protein
MFFFLGLDGAMISSALAKELVTTSRSMIALIESFLKQQSGYLGHIEQL